MGLFDDFVEKDIEIIWRVQEFFYRNPKLDLFMSRIVSKLPWLDVCALNWVIFAVGIFEIGSKHFWVVITNLAAAFLARKLISAKRPVEYDLRLQPLADINAESYGFPSLESYMSVVIIGHIYLHYEYLPLLLVAILYIFLVGLSRIYCRSRFPHQIIGSYFVAIIGLQMSMTCCEVSQIHKMHSHGHGCCVTFVLASLVINFALNMENNDSRLLGLPKQEFVKVLKSIISPVPEETSEPIISEDQDIVKNNSSENGRLKNIHPETSKKTFSSSNVVKHDSFYFLQKIMEERQREKGEIATKLPNRTEGTDFTSTPRSAKLQENMRRKQSAALNSGFEDDKSLIASRRRRQRSKINQSIGIYTDSRGANPPHLNRKVKNPYEKRSPRDWSGTEMDMYGSFAT